MYHRGTTAPCSFLKRLVLRWGASNFRSTCFVNSCVFALWSKPRLFFVCEPQEKHLSIGCEDRPRYVRTCRECWLSHDYARTVAICVLRMSCLWVCVRVGFEVLLHARGVVSMTCTFYVKRCLVLFWWCDVSKHFVALWQVSHSAWYSSPALWKRCLVETMRSLPDWWL